MKTEYWNGYSIRFIEKDGEWWAVAKDVAEALGYQLTTNMTRLLEENDKDIHKMNTLGGNQELLIVSEFGIYDAAFSSHKPEAKNFKRWVFTVLRALRQSSGLEGFQIFRMLDKEHQKEMMGKLSRALQHPVRVDFIKANTIANKAVSTKYGYPKMVKKADMSPAMLVDRQGFLESTVELMGFKEKYHLGLSVSEEVYKIASEGKENIS
ncbi:BRO-N domain-containing protein [Eisenbergiella porci]|uniref:BRO-N domain-containing protein n=1 Tax=Eisenbergiella porci TaxID=2652274 RepID=UPI002A81409C|nr:BRO family protein [Eisenbergiella porci]